MNKNGKKSWGGPGRGQGRKPKPPHLKKVRASNVRITKFKMDALRSLPVSLGVATETALDEKYGGLFQKWLKAIEENGCG